MQLVERVAARLRPSGINLIGTATAAAWDERAPTQLRASTLLPSARSVIVVASAGRGLWDRLRSTAPHRGEHPLDELVTRALDEVEPIFAEYGVAARRFEPTVAFEPRVDFRALGRIAGLGDVGPFGLLVHPEHGPWFGLRGAWLVDCELPSATISSPCVGCSAPCVADRGPTPLGEATANMRRRCPIGEASRYSDEQLAYHHDGARPAWLTE